MTIDVEEISHAENLREVCPQAGWERIPRRAGPLVEQFLAALRDADVRLTELG